MTETTQTKTATVDVVPEFEQCSACQHATLDEGPARTVTCKAMPLTYGGVDPETGRVIWSHPHPAWIEWCAQWTPGT